MVLNRLIPEWHMLSSPESSLNIPQKGLLVFFILMFVTTSVMVLANRMYAIEWLLMTFAWVGRNSYAASGFMERPSDGNLDWFISAMSVGMVCCACLLIRLWSNPDRRSGGQASANAFPYFLIGLCTWASAFLLPRMVS